MCSVALTGERKLESLGRWAGLGLGPASWLELWGWGCNLDLYTLLSRVPEDSGWVKWFFPWPCPAQGLALRDFRL